MIKYSISIIVPIYNAQDYIERCLDSIISQCSDDIAIECILVNDCTPDNSMDVVREKIRDNNDRVKFKIINHTVNKGASAARNSGIRVAEGDYLLFVDSDDYLEVGALKIFIEELNKVQNSETVDVVMANTFMCKDNNTTMKTDQRGTILIDNSDGNALRKLLSREVLHIVCNKLVKRDFIIKYRLFFEEGIVDEDLLWAYLVFSHAKSVLLIPQVTYVYCYNPNSVTNTQEARVMQLINSRIIICERILSKSSKGKDMIEYYVYIFFILQRAVDLYEKHKKVVANLKERLYAVRNSFLKEVWNNRHYMSFLIFLTLVKPFYYVNYSRLYRRYFDRINKIDITIGHMNPFITKQKGSQ